MIDSRSKPLEFNRSWQDAFGTVLASVESGSHKRTVMVIGSSEFSSIALKEPIDLSFRGRLILAILERLHGAPLEAVLRDQEPNFVVALEQSTLELALHGPAIQGESSVQTASTGLEYTEPGSYSAWTNRNTLTTDPQASSIIASVASGLGIPCLVCNPSDLKIALEFAFLK